MGKALTHIDLSAKAAAEWYPQGWGFALNEAPAAATITPSG